MNMSRVVLKGNRNHEHEGHEGPEGHEGHEGIPKKCQAHARPAVGRLFPRLNLVEQLSNVLDDGIAHGRIPLIVGHIVPASRLSR